MALETRPLSKYNTALPCRTEQMVASVAEHQRKRWALPAFEVMLHEKHASRLQTLMCEMLPVRERLRTGRKRSRIHTPGCMRMWGGWQHPTRYLHVFFFI